MISKVLNFIHAIPHPSTAENFGARWTLYESGGGSPELLAAPSTGPYQVLQEGTKRWPLYAKHCVMGFTCRILFNPHNIHSTEEPLRLRPIIHTSSHNQRFKPRSVLLQFASNLLDHRAAVHKTDFYFFLVVMLFSITFSNFQLQRHCHHWWLFKGKVLVVWRQSGSHDQQK